MKNKILLGITGVLVLLGATVAYGAVTSKFKTEDTGYSQNYSFLSATTTYAATSTNISNANDTGWFRIAGAKRVDIFFSRAATSTNTGTSTYSIQVTNNGTNWYAFNRLIPATSTAQTAQATDVIGQSTTTDMFGVDLRTNAFLGVRCIVTQTIDGSNSCSAYAEF
jgi:hypothetical protein